MWRNYFLTSLRNLIRYKTYSIITIFGLSLGIVICLGISLFLISELNYDRFHEDSNRLYRINSNLHFNDDHSFSSQVTSYKLFNYALEHIPLIESGTLAQHHSAGAIVNNNGERIIEKKGILFGDKYFLKVFHFPLLEGNKESALNEPFSVLLTPEKAAAYFGKTNPMGKTLTVSIEDTTLQFTVKGIIEPAPENSSVKYQLLFSYATLEALPSFELFNSWFNVSRIAYIKLRDGADRIETAKLLDEAVIEHTGERKFYDPFLQPITDIHLNTEGYDLYSAGDIKSLYLYGLLALLVLLIAIVNFINLATARAATREREVGMRKVLGDQRFQLFSKFIIESVLYVFSAGILSLLFTELFLSLFNDITGKELSIILLAEPLYIVLFPLLLLLTGIIAGIYPAFYLTGFRPIQLLRREQSKGSGGKNLRRALVVAQFTAAILLVSGSAYIFDQVTMMEKKKLGFSKEQVIQVPLFNKHVAEESFRWQARIEKMPGISSASVSQEIHHDGSSTNAFWFEGESEEDQRMIDVKAVSENLIKTLRFTMNEGRWFSTERQDDKANTFIVNETFVKEFNLKQPVGTLLYRNGEQGRIIGVVKNFHFQPFHYSIQPLVFYPMPVGNPYWHYLAEYMFIRLNEEHHSETIASLENSWLELFPDQPFTFQYLSEKIAGIYAAERRMGETVSIFAAFGIIVALLGLYGLSLFTIEQKRKEIGIRKVLGANSMSIVYVLSKEFILLVLISVAAAFPLVFFLLGMWLDNFAYHINLSPFIFLTAALLVLLTALLTVSIQAKRAGELNPIDTIRYE